jgi:hypothetical protein
MEVWRKHVEKLIAVSVFTPNWGELLGPVTVYMLKVMLVSIK